MMTPVYGSTITACYGMSTWISIDLKVPTITIPLKHVDCISCVTSFVLYFKCVMESIKSDYLKPSSRGNVMLHLCLQKDRKAISSGLLGNSLVTLGDKQVDHPIICCLYHSCN